MSALNYLNGYPEEVRDRVRELIASGELGPFLLRKYPERHNIQTSKALNKYVTELKRSALRQSTPISKICYDNKIHVVNHALGLHTFVSRVQGSKLKAKHEVRIASMLKEAPLELLRMVVVHELAHLREKEHNKAFYKLCTHMEPDYHQLEFELRLYLIYFESEGSLYA